MEDKSHSFSNPPVRLDLPCLLPLKLEKSLLLHSWSLTKIYLHLPAQKGQEESSVHSGVFGDRESLEASLLQPWLLWQEQWFQKQGNQQQLQGEQQLALIWRKG